MTAFTTLPFCTWPSGEASFTLAVITSPSPARRPVEPPSGRIICSLRAPELSATSSMDLIITAMFVSFSAFYFLAGFLSKRLVPHARTRVNLNFGHQSRLPHDFLQRPALQLRQPPRLFNPHLLARI